MASVRRNLVAASAGLIGVSAIGLMGHAVAVREYTADDPREGLAIILGRAADLSRPPLPYDDITDLLPNVRYDGPRGPQPVADVVVRGKVASVEPGRAYHSPNDGNPDGAEIDFHDPRVEWRTVTLHVDVIETLGPGEDVGSRVKVGLALAGAMTVEAVRAGFGVIDSAIFFLQKDSPVFAYDESLYADVLDGAFITEVRDDGVLRLPGFERVTRTPRFTDEKLLSRAATIGALRSEAVRPVVTRPMPPAQGEGGEA